MDHTCDLLVIGGGMAGLVAGSVASEAGLSTILLRKGQSATAFSSGAIDVIGYLPEATEPFTSPKEGLTAIAGLYPLHPYSILGYGEDIEPENVVSEIIGRTRESISWLKKTLRNTVASLYGDFKRNIFPITILGTTKPTCLVQKTMYSETLHKDEENVLLFAGFIHQSFPIVLLAPGGLVITAAVIGLSARSTSLGELFGLRRLDRKVLYYSITGLVLGIFLGILTRNRFEMTLIPEGFTGIAFVAPLIGATEELLFRGYMQGKLRRGGRAFSILSASAFHTSYKLLVILTLAMPLQFDFFFLIFWTFIGGILFGILRDFSGSSIPPVMAHAAFDIVLYGGMATAPVWVWS